MIAYEGVLNYAEELSDFVPAPPKKDKLGFDEVYMINLERRPDRRFKMDACFTELGVDYRWFKAVDGKKVRSVTMLPGLTITELPIVLKEHRESNQGCWVREFYLCAMQPPCK